MIIEMLQVHSLSEGPNSHIEYVFDKGGYIASFLANERPLLGSKFEGQYKRKGKENYTVVSENEACPDGYKETMFGYKQTQEDGTKISISKTKYKYYNENKELVGTLQHIGISPKKEKLFQLPQTYQYDEFIFKGQTYKMYDFRKRGTGVFYCIYKDNNLVAMVERNLTVRNWLDQYKIYSLDDVDIDFLCLATSHYDYTNFESTYLADDTYGPGSFSTETGDSTVEWRKEILNKYDPDFKNKIISMEK